MAIRGTTWTGYLGAAIKQLSLLLGDPLDPDATGVELPVLSIAAHPRQYIEGEFNITLDTIGEVKTAADVAGGFPDSPVTGAQVMADCYCVGQSGDPSTDGALALHGGDPTVAGVPLGNGQQIPTTRPDQLNFTLDPASAGDVVIVFEFYVLATA